MASPINQSEQDYLVDEEISVMKKAFKILDKDGDGRITTKQLGVLMRVIGENPTETELREMTNVDGNGTITFPEFLDWVVKKRKDDEFKETFRSFDKERSGFLSAADVSQGVSDFGVDMTEEEVDQMIKEADLDGDGKLSFDEFVNFMAQFCHDE